MADDESADLVNILSYYPVQNYVYSNVALATLPLIIQFLPSKRPCLSCRISKH